MLILVLVLSIAFYSISKNVFLAVVALASFLALVLKDLAPSDWSAGGIKTTIKEVVIAVVVAVGVWIALIVILQTSSPIDVVTSCSMVPVLERGDMIFLQGGEINVPTIKYSGAFPQFRVRSSQCTVDKAGLKTTSFCASSLELNGSVYAFNETNDVIVFAAQPAAYGLIVHRAWLRLENEKGEFLYLTKGDNNPVFDAQAGISVAPGDSVHGKVIFRIPFVGYLKLFMFGQFAEPTGCDTRVTYN